MYTVGIYSSKSQIFQLDRILNDLSVSHDTTQRRTNGKFIYRPFNIIKPSTVAPL